MSRSNPDELDQVIDVKYKEVEHYMMADKLILNQHKHHQDFGISLNTGAETILPTYSEKLLGGFITNDFNQSVSLQVTHIQSQCFS